MKNQKLFDRTIGILVNAYLKGMLKHSDCTACAVGNLCLGNGMPLLYDTSVVSSQLSNAVWVFAFSTDKSGKQTINNNYYHGVVKTVIDSTGYGMYDLAAIEYAFETAQKGNSEDDWMFNGLMSVCDTLMQIHEATTDEITEAKRLFVKEPA